MQGVFAIMGPSQFNRAALINKVMSKHLEANYACNFLITTCGSVLIPAFQNLLLEDRWAPKGFWLIAKHKR